MVDLRQDGPRRYGRGRYGPAGLLLIALALLGVVLPQAVTAAPGERPVLERFLIKVPAGRLVEGADGYGALETDPPVAEIRRDGAVVGHAFVTSDFVATTGYSGKPIHILMAVGPEAKILSAELVEHSEPIVLIGIPERKMRALIEGYRDLDLVAEAAAGGSAHDLDIISGATVTVMIIDDSIIRAGLKVARALGLGGLRAKAGHGGPTREIDPAAAEESEWSVLAGNGAVRRLSLDIGQINAAFAESGDERASARPEKGDPAETYIDLRTALVSVPAIGRALLGPAEYTNLEAWLAPGEHAILVAGRGRYSFKGSGYVRGGIFDRIHLIQGEGSVRFRDRGHRRLGEIALAGAPSFTELDLFKIPAEAGFEPTEPWRLQLLAHRAIGAIKKSFLTFDLAYLLPDAYTRPLAVASVLSGDDAEALAQQRLWQRVWRANAVEVAGLLVMLMVLTAAFFFQKTLTINERVTRWFRYTFLLATLVFLGWHANAQLSVVNLMALIGAMTTKFTWSAFLLDPLVFILWFSVAAALIFWGRGAYCGWLCPFGALQELTNRLARRLRVPQLNIPWSVHERLWPLKYLIFLALLGISFVSLPVAEGFAEVEPFKTAIILKFQRPAPYVVLAVTLLVIGLFVERFYCRYFCALGAALAIPGRMRMFAWLKRYHQCGDPCQICANECMVQAINPLGEINPNECLNCLHCQVRYQDKQVCPVCIKRTRRQANLRGDTPVGAAAGHQRRI